MFNCLLINVCFKRVEEGRIIKKQGFNEFTVNACKIYIFLNLSK